MTRRKRSRQWSMSLTAATVESPTAVAAAPTDGFHALLAPEGVWSSDGRMFALNSLSVREGPNDQPLMGLIENTEMHDRSINVGHFTSMSRRDDGWWEGTGVWADSPEALAIRARVRAGDVTGISVDAAVTECEHLTPAESYDAMMAMFDDDEMTEPSEPERVNIDGVEYIVSKNVPDLMRATTGELMGATICPFPAFEGATITDLSPEANLEPVVAVTAAAAPVAPPRVWFDAPDVNLGAYDVEIDEDGHIHGYPAATWDSCHLSFPDECITPPRSQTDYAYFRPGQGVRTAEGDVIRTGPLTLRGGHADRTWSLARAMAFYDDTDSAFADVNIGENQHGMWIAGALRPSASPADVRVAMASGFSGDWRWTGRSHELIALSAVNTPGFRQHASLYENHGLVASMILDMPRSNEDDVLIASAVRRIAMSIGRTPEQRIAALRARVHPELQEVH